MAKLQKQTQNWEKCWIKKREIFQLEYFCWRISSFGKAVCGKDVAKIIPQQSTAAKHRFLASHFDNAKIYEGRITAAMCKL